MLWYIVICVAMLYPLSIVCVGSLSGKKTQEIALISGCVILWFFMAMRATTVGVDTQYYSYVFTQFAEIPLSEVFSAVTYATESETWAFDFEPGYRLLNKIVSFFCADPQVITIVNSTIIFILLYRLIRRNSANFLLSLWLYLTLGIFQTEMNVTRNAIAILLVYNGFSYIQSKNAGKYVICCLVASLFHIASLVFIPIYWLAQIYKPNMKNSIFMIGLFFLIGIPFPFISPYIRLVLPDALDKYFMRGNDNLSSILVGLFNAGLFMMVYLLLDRKSRNHVVNTTARNYTPYPFSGAESRALRDLVWASSPDVVIDFHGWLNYTIGNGNLAEVFSLNLGLNHNKELTSSASGYFSYWAQLQGAEAILVEFKNSSSVNHNEVIAAVDRIITNNYGNNQFDYELDSRFAAFNGIRCYANTSDKVYTQSAVGNTGTTYGYIDGANDLCTIQQVYANGWCKVRYPAGSAGYTKTGYCDFSAFIDPDTAVEHYAARVGETVKVYTTQSGTTSLGSVWSTDIFTVVAKADGMAQIIYPLDDGGYKMGWIDYNAIS